MISIFVFALVAFASGAHIPTRELNPKIVGGHEVPISMIPYQAALFYDGIFICGATIVNENTLLTAASCTDGKVVEKFVVKAGITHLDGYGHNFNLKKIIQHEKYSQVNQDNDIAILKLTEKIDFDDFMQPLRIIEAGVEIMTGARCLVSGWGATVFGGSNVNTLRMGLVRTIEQDTCVKAYQGLYQITENMMCTQFNGQDACVGDGGGPLVLFDSIVGIISWGKGCADPQYPGVYTKISVVRPWIDQHINDV